MGSITRTARNLGIRRAVTVGFFATVTALAPTCSNDDSHPPKINVDQAIGQWCPAYCTWARACGYYLTPSCTTDCLANGGFKAYGRVEFYQAMTACLVNDSDCPGGGDASWKACYEEASLQIPLSQAAFDFCQSVGGLFYECDYNEAPTTCARNYIFLNDAKLVQLEVCATESCDTYSQCVDRVSQVVY